MRKPTKPAKPGRVAGAVGLLVVSLVVLLFWTGSVFSSSGFLWLDRPLAWRFTARWAALTAVLIIVLGTAIVHLLARSTSNAAERPAEGPATTTETAATILDFRRAGIKGLVVGADGRASTSQFQAVLWFAALLFGLIFLLLLARSPNCPLPAGVQHTGSCPVVRTGAPFPDALGKNFRWEYLILIGWPLTVAITARKQVLDALGKLRDKGTEDGANEDAAQAGTPEAAGKNSNVAVDGKITPVSAKSPPTTPASIGINAGIRDLLCNDRGHGSLMDVQILAFTLVTISYFLLEVVSHPGKGLPEIPAALLVLMGISGGGYLGAKAIDPLGTAGTAASPGSAVEPVTDEIGELKAELASAKDALRDVRAERDGIAAELEAATRTAARTDKGPTHAA